MLPSVSGPHVERLLTRSTPRARRLQHACADAYETAAELVAFTKANYGLEDPKTQGPRCSYAVACAKLGRVEEAKANFEDLLRTQSRIYGRDHPLTQDTLGHMQRLNLLAESSG